MTAARGINSRRRFRCWSHCVPITRCVSVTTTPVASQVRPFSGGTAFRTGRLRVLSGCGRFRPPQSSEALNTCAIIVNGLKTSPSSPLTGRLWPQLTGERPTRRLFGYAKRLRETPRPAMACFGSAGIKEVFVLSSLYCDRACLHCWLWILRIVGQYLHQVR